MATVWIIVNKSRQVVGHGESAEVYALATVDPYNEHAFHPAFTSAQSALEYIDSLGLNKHGLQAIQMEAK